MYSILNLKSGETFYVDEPRYVKLDGRIWRRCEAEVAECISINGKRFSIAGKNLVEDAPDIVAISTVDAGFQLNKILSDSLQNAQNIDDVKAAIEDIVDAVLDIYENGI